MSIELASKPLQTFSGHEDAILRIAYLAGELVTCSADKTTRIWDVESGEQEGMPMEDDGWVQGLAITRDGMRIVSGGLDGALRVWDAETHELVEEWSGHENAICDIAMSPCGQVLASCDSKGRVIIREMEEGGEIMRSIETGPNYINSICFSPDGQSLASAHDDMMIRVFDVESGDLILGPIEGHTDYVHAVIWSLDGRQLFTASWDQTIRSWDSATGEAIGQPWIGHTDHVNSISLSPDGKKLASASSDQTVRFWATDTGDPIGHPLQHEDVVWTVPFSPTGEFVVCGGSDGKISSWRVPWWNASTEKAHFSFLDRPAVPVPRGASNAVHQTAAEFFGHRPPDYLDPPAFTSPSYPSHTTEEASRTRSSAFTWKLWRIPRLLFRRSHGLPRPAETTIVYRGYATQRVYVASNDSGSTSESSFIDPTTAPGHYPRYSIVVESVSSTSSPSVDRATPAPQDNLENVQVSCFAIFSRRKAGAGTVIAAPAPERSQRAARTANPPTPLVARAASPHQTAQGVLGFPAVAGS